MPAPADAAMVTDEVTDANLVMNSFGMPELLADAHFALDLFGMLELAPDERGLFRLLSTGEVREAGEVLELPRTLGAELVATKQTLVELYSPPRVIAEITTLLTVHLTPGDTFDFREGRGGRCWDSLVAADRAEARRRILE